MTPARREPGDEVVARLSLPVSVAAFGMLVDALLVAYGDELRVRGGEGALVVVRPARGQEEGS